MVGEMVHEFGHIAYGNQVVKYHQDPLIRKKATSLEK